MSPAPGPQGESGSYIDFLNRLFNVIGVWSYDHRWIVMGASLAAVGAAILAAAQIRFDNSFEAFFDSEDPVYSAYQDFREDFGSDEVSYIVYEAPGYEHGAWNLEVMRKIASLGRALEEEVPFVDEMTSLVNTEFLEPVPDGIRAEELLEDFPETQEALLAIRDKVLAKPIYIGSLASADGQYAGIILSMEKSSTDPITEIRLDPDAGDELGNLYPQVSYHAIEAILARPEYEGIVFHHTGDVPLNSVINELVGADAQRLGGFTLLVIAGVLFFFFRSFLGVVGPLIVVALSVLFSIAFAQLMGWELNMMFGMLPTLLIAVGVADAVHIISEFRTYRVEFGDRREALRRTLTLVGTPCLLTSVTTAVGFASMSVAPIKTIADFAVYAAVGVLSAFLLSITLLVALLTLGRRNTGASSHEQEVIRAKGGERFVAALDAVARFDIRHRRAILAVAAILFVFSVAGIVQIEVDSNTLGDFGKHIPVRQATEFADEVMSGTNSYVYVFDSGEPDGIKEPAVLREIERLQERALSVGDIVTKTHSIVDILKDINQTFHNGDPAYHVLPETRNLIAQYLLVYELSGGEEVEDYVSSDFSRATLELRCKWVSTNLIADMAQSLDDYLEGAPLTASSASATGIGALWMQLLNFITESQLRGVSIALVSITLLMCLLFRSVKTGLIAMVPNLSPVFITLGAMGWMGISLNYTTLFIAPVAIGIAVDNTMHLVTRFRHKFGIHGDYRRALFASIQDVGRALFITSVVLVLGFLVLLFSDMDSQVHFGLLLSSTIVIALVADFTLLPALALTLHPFGPERETNLELPESH